MSTYYHMIIILFFMVAHEATSGTRLSHREFIMWILIFMTKSIEVGSNKDTPKC